MVDDEDYKSRITKAIEKYTIKHDPYGNQITNKKHNKSPEKDLQKEVLSWLNSDDMGWDIECIESKSIFSEVAGRYIAQAATPGLSDLVGNDSDGRACFIEMKAPGKRGTLRDNQREFLIRKINKNCFAICADSKSYIESTYKIWLRTQDGVKYLLNELPEKKLGKDPSDRLFE